MKSLSCAALGLAVAGLGACTAFDTPENYNRHRLSDITLPRDPGVDSEVFYFDASVTGEFPDGSAEAEAARMRWLQAWLEQRNMCASGHEVLARRGFGELEDNPARRDLRYEVRCRSSGGGNAP